MTRTYLHFLDRLVFVSAKGCHSFSRMIEQNRSQALTSSQGRVLMSRHANTDSNVVALFVNILLTTVVSQSLLPCFFFFVDL